LPFLDEPAPALRCDIAFQFPRSPAKLPNLLSSSLIQQKAAGFLAVIFRHIDTNDRMTPP
jgi:hypothetical protein